MLAKERQYNILSLLRANGAVTVTELIDRFHVSIETIRRDLLQLEKQGSLQRVHGGAILFGDMMPVSELPQRLEENKDGKIELCEEAVKLVRNGDILYVDTGATALYFAKSLCARFSSLTVVTNSEDVFQILTGKEGFSVILCGGHYMREERAFYGILAQETLKQIYVDKAFVFPSAVSLQCGVCDYNHELMLIQRQIIGRCHKLYFLADSQKFERHGLLKLCETAGCTFVTDAGINENFLQLYAEKDVHIIVAGKE